MWISNSATAAMMITIVQAVIGQLKESDRQIAIETDRQIAIETNRQIADETDEPENGQNCSERSSESGNNELVSKWDKTAKALCLSIAYAATCGGIATLTGTAPNLIMTENLERFVTTWNFFLSAAS